MIARWILISTVAIASVASADPTSPPSTAPAPAAGATRHRAVITDPDWLRKPGPDDFSAYWPVGVTVSGSVGIQCDVTASGTLAGCVITSESPEGVGFGKAALKISRLFRMKPATRDGAPVGGGIFQTTIHFAWDGLNIPYWVHRPTPQEMQAVWPDASVDQATVELDCRITVRGKLTGCSVDSETPAHKGFGKAALKLVPKMLMSPARQDGRPVDAYIKVPLVFVKPMPQQNGLAKFEGDLQGLSGAPWQSAPSQAEIAAAWPKSAPPDLPSAHVRLRCAFQPDSSLAPCELLSEDPPGYGFGQAALRLASRFRTMGALMDEETLKKARVILPFTFTNPSMGPQSPERITNPNWVTFIDEDRMVALYPDAAAKAGVKTGRVMVECVIATGGGLSNCTVKSEDPPGQGFGPSALLAMKAFTVNPWTADGRPVDGARITVPIRFVEDEPPAEPPPATSSGKAAPGAPANP